MKLIYILTFLLSTTTSYAQDCCEIAKLPFETLDSNEIKSITAMTNDLVHRIICFDSEDGVKLAYRKATENKWIAVSLPFTTPVIGIRTINLDGKGQPEIIIEGSIQDYGSGGGRQMAEMLIINVDSVPTQIFDVFFSCLEEGSGKYGGKPIAIGYQRKITFVGHQIIIAPFNKRKIPYRECEITKIPAGVYVMADGRIKRKK